MTPTGLDGRAPASEHLDDPDYPAANNQVLVNPPLDAISLFPTYLSSAIKRIPHPDDENAFVAAISMIFPEAPYPDRFGCQMVLDVLASKVERLALELFDTCLETNEGLRYILQPDGGMITPAPKLILQACQYKAIPNIFGSVASGIMASPPYQKDVKQRKMRTGSVSMVVSHLASEGAVISVYLGLREGTEIKKAIFLA